MKSLRLFIYLLLAVCLNGCRENHAMPLFNHDSLQDNIVFYLESLQDIQNVVCNPTTTFVNIFTRNDSLVVIIDSEPEKDRIVIPGINCSEAEVFCGTGYYLNRIVSIFCEPEYCYLVNLSSLGHIPLNEKRRLSKMRRANDEGWFKQKFYREYFISGNKLYLLNSSDPKSINKVYNGDNPK